MGQQIELKHLVMLDLMELRYIQYYKKLVLAKQLDRYSNNLMDLIPLAKNRC